MDPKTTDPVIIDLLQWLGENLPGIAEEDIFKQVRKVQKVFDTIMALTFETLYKHTPLTPQAEEIINTKLEELKEIVVVNEETRQKIKKLEESRAKLDLKKEQYNLVTSIKLDGCMDLISRYNHLMAKK
jgi:hypothetical protein